MNYIYGNTLVLGDSSYLEHHGIKNQKWGVRRFQNPDGTLTAAGRIRYGVTGAAKAVFNVGKKAGEATATAVKTGARKAGAAAKARVQKAKDDAHAKKKEKASESRESVLKNKDLFTNEELKKLEERFKIEDDMRNAGLRHAQEIAKTLKAAGEAGVQVANAIQTGGEAVQNISLGVSKIMEAKEAISVSEAAEEAGMSTTDYKAYTKARTEYKVQQDNAKDDEAREAAKKAQAEHEERKKQAKEAAAKKAEEDRIASEKKAAEDEVAAKKRAYEDSVAASNKQKQDIMDSIKARKQAKADAEQAKKDQAAAERKEQRALKKEAKERDTLDKVNRIKDELEKHKSETNAERDKKAAEAESKVSGKLDEAKSKLNKQVDKYNQQRSVGKLYDDDDTIYSQAIDAATRNHLYDIGKLSKTNISKKDYKTVKRGLDRVDSVYGEHDEGDSPIGVLKKAKVKNERYKQGWVSDTQKEAANLANAQSDYKSKQLAARSALKTYYKSKNMSDSEIEKNIKRFEASNSAPSSPDNPKSRSTSGKTNGSIRGSIQSIINASGGSKSTLNKLKQLAKQHEKAVKDAPDIDAVNAKYLRQLEALAKKVKHSAIGVDMYSEDFIAHHGVKGQKWGIRRFQNPDGTLNKRGRKHYQKKVDKLKRQQVVSDVRRGAIERYHKPMVAATAVGSAIVAGIAGAMVMTNPATIAAGMAIAAVVSGGSAHIDYAIREAWEGRGTRRRQKKIAKYESMLKQDGFTIQNGVLMYGTSDSLEHHGLKGMKWGQRRFQNQDGSLTAAGRARYSKGGVDSTGGGGGGGGAPEEDEETKKKIEEAAKKAGMSVDEYRKKFADKVSEIKQKAASAARDAKSEIGYRAENAVDAVTGQKSKKMAKRWLEEARSADARAESAKSKYISGTRNPDSFEGGLRKSNNAVVEKNQRRAKLAQQQAKNWTDSYKSSLVGRAETAYKNITSKKTKETKNRKIKGKHELTDAEHEAALNSFANIRRSSKMTGNPKAKHRVGSGATSRQKANIKGLKSKVGNAIYNAAGGKYKKEAQDLRKRQKESIQRARVEAHDRDRQKGDSNAHNERFNAKVYAEFGRQSQKAYEKSLAGRYDKLKTNMKSKKTTNNGSATKSTSRSLYSAGYKLTGNPKAKHQVRSGTPTRGGALELAVQIAGDQLKKRKAKKPGHSTSDVGGSGGHFSGSKRQDYVGRKKTKSGKTGSIDIRHDKPLGHEYSQRGMKKKQKKSQTFKDPITLIADHSVGDLQSHLKNGGERKKKKKR